MTHHSQRMLHSLRSVAIVNFRVNVSIPVFHPKTFDIEIIFLNIWHNGNNHGLFHHFLIFWPSSSPSVFESKLKTERQIFYKVYRFHSIFPLGSSYQLNCPNCYKILHVAEHLFLFSLLWFQRQMCFFSVLKRSFRLVMQITQLLFHTLFNNFSWSWRCPKVLCQSQNFVIA